MWTGGITPYQGTIYFVNKMVSMAIDWGTDSPIKLNDPLYNVPIGITSYGDYAIQVIDGRLLMEKLVGTTVGFTQDDLKTMKAFRKLRTGDYGYLVLADRLLQEYRKGR